MSSPIGTTYNTRTSGISSVESNDNISFDDLSEPDVDVDVDLLDLSFDDDYDDDDDEHDEQVHDSIHSHGHGSGSGEPLMTTSMPIMDGSLPPKYNSMMEEDLDYSDYIVGTLIVRLVSAKDLKSVMNGFQQAGALFGKGKSTSMNQSSNHHQQQQHQQHQQNHNHNFFKNRNIHSTFKSRRKKIMTGSANPYATIVFGTQSEQSTFVIDTVNPSWPRDEEFCLDVTLPVPKLIQTNDQHHDYDHGLPSKHSSSSSIHETCSEWKEKRRVNLPIKPMLTIALWHSHEDSQSQVLKGDPPKKQKGTTSGMDERMEMGGSSDDFLGICSIDVTSLITGKQPHLDEWFELGGGEDITGRVRLKIGYEPSDTPFRPGDSVRMTGFVNPLDLFPVPSNQVYTVDHVINEDEVILSYRTTENWRCNFLAHRYMLISVKRHETALERYQEEILELSHRLSYSPAADAVSQTITRLPEEGILFIGVEAAFRSADLMGRWMNGGVKLFADDVINATNLDGRHNPNVDDNITISSSSCYQSESVENLNLDYDDDDDLSVDDQEDNGMPCCPISGLPMKDPVVAADGHTYERAAISRWLRESDISPLTGGRLPHKELAPNYLLLSSVHESKNSKPSSEVSQC